MSYVMQHDGVILYDTDAAQIGLNIFTDPSYKDYSELLALSRRMQAEPEGNGQYTFLIHGTQKIARKEAAWRTLSFYGKKWIVVAYRELPSAAQGE